MKLSDAIMERCTLAMLRAGQKALIDAGEPDPGEGKVAAEDAWNEADAAQRKALFAVVEAIVEAVFPDLAPDDRRVLVENLRSMAEDFRYNEPEVGIFGSEPLGDATSVLADLVEVDCPGHVASDADPKICRYCGTNVEEYRDEPREEE